MLLEIGLLCLMILLLFYWKLTRKAGFFQDRGVPFSKPIFPIGSKYVWRAMAGQISFLDVDKLTVEDGFQHEKLIGMYFLGEPYFIINDEEIAKKILIKDFDFFMDRRVVESEDKYFSNFLTQLTGLEWKQMRSLMGGVFTSGKLKLMSKHIVQVGHNFEEFISEIAEQGTEVDMKVVGGQMTLDSIASAGFGIETNSFKEPNNQFRVMAMILVGAPGYTSQLQMVKIIFLMLSPKLGKLLNIQILDQRALNFFVDIIRKTYNHRINTGEKRNDIIDILVDEITSSKNMPSKKENKFESEFEKDAAIDTSDLRHAKDYDEETVLVSNALLFFFAGFETTSSGFSICCHKLALHSDIQEKIFDEIEEIIGTDKSVNFDKIQELKYMDMFISECFRHQMIIPFHERKCTKDYKIPGTEIIIPKDMYVKVYTGNITKSERNFLNPREFDPENFNPENKPNKFGSQMFGQGPRNCIGMRYALLTIKVSLVYLLRKHRVLRGPKTTDTLEVDIKNMNVFKKGVFVKIEKRA